LRNGYEHGTARLPAPLRGVKGVSGSRRSCRPLYCALLLLAGMALGGCGRGGLSLDELRDGGELRVALLSVPHTYYLEDDGIRGFDYELLRAFCDEIGVQLKPTFVNSRAEAIKLIRKRRVHLAAGLVPVNYSADPGIDFGPSYAMLQALVVYRAGRSAPDKLDDLRGTSIATPAGGVGALELNRLARVSDNLQFSTRGLSTDQILAAVNAGKTDFAVVSGLDFQVQRLKYPRLEIAFELGNTRAAAWALAAPVKPDLYEAISSFFASAKTLKLRQRLWDRYYGHYGEFDFVDARAFLRAYHERLPEFRQAFELAGNEVGIDWRLLAALSYQESHWNPDARSPTGVRGLMMLTRHTAKRLNVRPENPDEAISGGARYLAGLIERLSESILEEDRLWFGLAAYNLGFGHVQDARVLADRAGHNPNSWHDVQRYVGLLANKKIAKNTRFGAARGGQTLDFVTNIRRYLDALRQLERHPAGAAEPATRSLLSDLIAL